MLQIKSNSIGPTETMHFQTWSDKAGNAPLLTAGEDLKANLIMPEPCPFLTRNLPICSIIRPTETKGLAMRVVKFLSNMGLSIGQSKEFFAFLTDLAEDANAARRGRG
jgi:hypothetical protein